MTTIAGARDGAFSRESCDDVFSRQVIRAVQYCKEVYGVEYSAPKVLAAESVVSTPTRSDWILLPPLAVVLVVYGSVWAAAMLMCGGHVQAIDYTWWGSIYVHCG
jgi:hypothetical protein